MVTVITVTAGLISTILTYILGVLKTKRQLIVKSDQRVLKEGLTEYKELWKLFLPLAKDNNQEYTTYGILRDFSISMSERYYEVRGLYPICESKKENFVPNVFKDY